MTPAEIAAEIARLQALLAARTGQPGWRDNCKSIQARIDELKAMT